LVVKRQTGGVGRTDILVIGLIAEVAGPGFTANYFQSSKARCWSRRCYSGATQSNG